MRQLEKEDEPGVLTVNGAAWTQKFTADVASGRKSSPWRDPAIVENLVKETRGKCAYCEAVIADVAPRHVEHIAPKSERPDLVVSWLNLTLACPNCNSNKGTYYSISEPLMNPYQDDPKDHLMFAGPAVTGRAEDELGKRTVHRLRLMRTPLLLERAKRIQSLFTLIERWDLESNSDIKKLYAEAVRDELTDDAEFAGTLRAYAEVIGFEISEPANILS